MTCDDNVTVIWTFCVLRLAEDAATKFEGA
jgi:hypothetical protein